MTLLIIGLLSTLGTLIFIRDSRDSCTSIEKYDAIRGQCYYECDTDEECAKKEALVEAELNSYFESTKSKVDISNGSVSTPKKEESAVQHTYNNGRFSPEISDNSEKEIWGYFLTIAGADFAKQNITKVSFYNDKDSDTSAAVNQDEQDSSKWDLSVNLAHKDDTKELLMTLVHEYAHIYSLNSAEVDGKVANSCPHLSISEGCAKDGSMINQFNKKFWANLNADANSEEFGKYYAANPDNFTSEYAATNTIEDFAETFAYATLKNTQKYPESAKSKVAFMEGNPKINANMSRIRAELGQALVRSKQIIDK